MTNYIKRSAESCEHPKLWEYKQNGTLIKFNIEHVDNMFMYDEVWFEKTTVVNI